MGLKSIVFSAATIWNRLTKTSCSSTTSNFRTTATGNKSMLNEMLGLRSELPMTPNVAEQCFRAEEMLILLSATGKIHGEYESLLKRVLGCELDWSYAIET